LAIVIGASAGGVQAISDLLAALPPRLPAIVLVALHRPPETESYLREILSRASTLPVDVATAGQVLQHGRCYIGEPARHLTLGSGLRARLIQDGFYRGHSIDALFQSAARHAGRRAIGVILSGMMKDGVLGLAAIKEAGGVALVQSLEEAAYDEMPRGAIEYDGPIDLVAPVHELAAEIARRVEPIQTAATRPAASVS
jgi:chemotaxis response regulator CheB